MGKKNYYLGIDLGTTNSLIAWGRIDPRTNQIETKTIDINMMIAGGGMGRSNLLPSFVYFKEKSVAIVGAYAKDMQGRQPDRVVKSVKSLIGTNKSFEFDGKKHTPAEISALILKHMVHSAESFFGFIPNDVVIAVPASFDSDMRNATIEAARLAGFKIQEDDGSPRNILLSEPKAALYDFINRQNKGEIPDSLIDFRKSQNVLVFDLGGGTLDVSLHKIFLNGETGSIEIEDYAISRYTRIGGDDFDRYLADEFMKVFSRKVNLSELNNFQRNDLLAKFLQIAEEAKMELSSEIENRRIAGLTDFDAVEIEIIKANIFDNKLFEYDLSLSKYEQITDNLLGKDLDLVSLQRIDKLDDKQMNNIIYPILDVLRKANEKSGAEIHVDAVLLNGGMTKLYCIQKRLEVFFGFKPIAVGDPDKAVARGAVVYHYNLHRGIRPTTILNDTIGIEVAGGYVKHLVPAGTVLPFKSKIYKDFVVQNDGACYLDLPFYLGRSKSTGMPNRKIASRRVKFSRPLQEGDPISFQVSVDEMNIMTADGWLENDAEHKFTITVLPYQEERQSDLKAQSVPPTGFVRPVKRQDDQLFRETLNVRDVLNSLRNLFSRIGNCYTPVNRPAMGKIRSIENSILKASNRQDFIEPLLDLLDNTNNEGRGRILILLGNLAEYYPDSAVRIGQVAMAYSDPLTVEMKNTRVVNTLIKYAVETLGKTGLPMAESHFINLLYKNNVDAIRSSILHSIGKTGNSANAVNHLKTYLRSYKIGERIAAGWSLGRVGSREKDNCLPIEQVRGVIPLLLNTLKAETHQDAQRNYVYALGEICDRRFPEKGIIDRVEGDKAISVLNQFQKSSSSYTSLSQLSNMRQSIILENFVQVAVSMIAGVALSQDEEQQLLAIRTVLAG